MAKSAGQLNSAKQEKRITRSLNQIKLDAKRQLGSGNKWFAKSDVICRLFQIEAKTKAKESKSINIKKEWHDKIEVEAAEQRKLPVLVYSFGDNVDYYSMRGEDFIALVEELETLKRGKSEG